MCGALFIIPAPVAPAASPSPGPADVRGARRTHPPAPFPGISPQRRPASTPRPAAPTPFDTKEPELLHIPCPECKQVLETPVEMLDQDVMCPHCQAQFQLRRRDSMEFKRKKEQQQQIKEHKAGKAWFNWAIVVVVLVLMFLLILVFSST
jgi:hypothetical protein